MSTDDPINDESDHEAPSEEVAELIERHNFDQDTAERVQEVMEEYDVDEDEAVEIEENL